MMNKKEKTAWVTLKTDGLPVRQARQRGRRHAVDLSCETLKVRRKCAAP